MLSKVRMAVSFQEISVVTRNESGRGIVRGLDPEKTFNGVGGAIMGHIIMTRSQE